MQCSGDIGPVLCPPLPRCSMRWTVQTLGSYLKRTDSQVGESPKLAPDAIFPIFLG